MRTARPTPWTPLSEVLDLTIWLQAAQAVIDERERMPDGQYALHASRRDLGVGQVVHANGIG